jgi:feruloyl esterase
MAVSTLLSVCVSAQATTATNSKLLSQKEFGSNPGNLRMYYFLPDSLVQKKLVVVLHGCSQTAQSCAQQTGWNDLARAQGFALLYPEQDLLNNVNTCFNWFNPEDQDTASGEAASIRSMMVWMKKRYALEEVYVTGLSAGAAMANILMVNFPRLITKGALFAGGPYGAASSALDAPKAMNGKVTKTPQQWAELARNANPGYNGAYPQVAIFQGTGDMVVNKNNAYELVKQWTALHQIDTVADAVIANYWNNPRITRKIYTDSSAHVPVQLMLFSKLSHALPVDPNGVHYRGGKTGMFATDLNFHSTAWVAQWFGVMPSGVQINVNESGSNKGAASYGIRLVQPDLGSLECFIISGGDIGEPTRTSKSVLLFRQKRIMIYRVVVKNAQGNILSDQIEFAGEGI